MDPADIHTILLLKTFVPSKLNQETVNMKEDFNLIVNKCRWTPWTQTENTQWQPLTGKALRQFVAS